MHTPSWMLLRLALETRQHHARADADRIMLMDASCELEYRRHLARIYGFEAPVETALERVPDIEPQVVAARKRADRLRADLTALGMTTRQIDQLPRCVVAIQSPAQAFGWMFVVERLSLLAGLIRRHLARQLPDTMQVAGAYLGAYDDRAGALFRALGDACGRHAGQNAVEPAAMVAAANRAFHRQRDWFAKLRARPITGSFPEPADAA